MMTRDTTMTMMSDTMGREGVLRATSTAEAAAAATLDEDRGATVHTESTGGGAKRIHKRRLGS